MTQWYVFTDGSIRNNGKPDARGSSGVIFYNNDTKEEFQAYTVYKGVTNTQTEIMAVLYAISFIRDNMGNLFSHKDNITFFTDNNSVVKSINEFSNKWITNNWKAYNGNLIKNAKYWKLLISIKNTMNNISYVWIKAHVSKNLMPKDDSRFFFQYNNKVDELVTETVDKDDYDNDIDIDTMYEYLKNVFESKGGIVYE